MDKFEKILDLKICIIKVKKCMSYALDRKLLEFDNEMNESENKISSIRKGASFHLKLYWIIFILLMLSKIIFSIPTIAYNIILYSNIACLFVAIPIRAHKLNKINKKSCKRSVGNAFSLLNATTAMHLYAASLEERYNRVIGELSEEERKQLDEFFEEHQDEINEAINEIYDDDKVREVFSNIDEENKKEQADSYREYLEYVDSFKEDTIDGEFVEVESTPQVDEKGYSRKIKFN